MVDVGGEIEEVCVVGRVFCGGGLVEEVDGGAGERALLDPVGVLVADEVGALDEGEGLCDGLLVKEEEEAGGMSLDGEEILYDELGAAVEAGAIRLVDEGEARSEEGQRNAVVVLAEGRVDFGLVGMEVGYVQGRDGQDHVAIALSRRVSAGRRGPGVEGRVRGPGSRAGRCGL